MGEFWDTHDLADFWDLTEPAEFQVDIQSSTVYFAVEPDLSEQVAKVARRKGVNPETLVNLWIQERLQKEAV